MNYSSQSKLVFLYRSNRGTYKLKIFGFINIRVKKQFVRKLGIKIRLSIPKRKDVFKTSVSTPGSE